MADGKVDIKIYTLKIVYDKATGEILHLSESMDSDGEVTFTIDGEILVVPQELADILNELEDTNLGIA